LVTYLGILLKHLNLAETASFAMISFEHKFIKRDLRAKLLGLLVTQRLTDDAMPTIMERRKTTADVSSKEQREQIGGNQNVNDVVVI